MNKQICLLGLVLCCALLVPAGAFAAEEIGSSPLARYFVVRSQAEEIDPVTQHVERTAWLEYPPGRYELELEQGIQSVRLLKLSFPGEFERVEQRLAAIRERLEYAMDGLSMGSAPYIAIRKTTKGVGIYAYRSPSYTAGTPGYYPVRIMTVFEEDARSFAFLDPWDEQTGLVGSRIRTPESLAAFLAAQIEAHFLLFLKNEASYDLYEKLALDASVSGKVYKELYISANDVKKLTGRPFNAQTISDGLGRILIYQRKRLQSLSELVPRDWDPQQRGLLFR